MKAFLREYVAEGFGERLLVGRAAAQSIAADLLVIEIDLGPYQAMDPVRVHHPAPAQDPDRPVRIGAAQIDHQPAGAALEIQPPSFSGRPAAVERLRCDRPAAAGTPRRSGRWRTERRGRWDDGSAARPFAARGD